MYNSQKSAKVTLIITFFFCAALVALMIIAHPLLEWFYGSERKTVIKTVMYAFYFCCPAAWISLGSIIKLLFNIINNKIFITQNVNCIRILSWCCAFVSLVCFCTSFAYVTFFVFFIISIAAAFMMLILRVLKNVMAKATEIKKENDLTI
ncbi:MAG: DUF2975 domain-containing protein [Faecalibacterium sp.]|nr:DUF2975 domain-containing protein [Ruminococcus sp.]MCM1392837.1 DUF2975 domain-containing protein [Ruminococcus sp.]MCM1486333.1 DUF2975 domain-containing protein [Faecalibacterium sp.]